MIYFDNAATSWPKPKIVIDKTKEAMEKAGNPGRGSHQSAMWSAKEIFHARKNIAELFNVPDPLHIAFTSNATEALNFAINLIDGNIITTSMEHNSVLRPCYSKTGVDIVYADSNGFLNVDDILNRINKKTKAVVMTHVSNVTGAVYDISAIGKACREKNIVFIVDGAQSAGVVPVDVVGMNIDIFCFTGHKGLFGPQGTGGIYISPRLREILKPLKRGGTGTNSFSLDHPCEMPEVAEAGTLNTHGIAALGAGAGYVKNIGISRIWAYERYLANVFSNELMSIKNAKVYGDFSKTHSGIVSFTMEGKDNSYICYELNKKNICARCGAHCAPLAHETLNTSEQGTVRFSFGYHNTLEEVHFALEVLSEIANKV